SLGQTVDFQHAFLSARPAVPRSSPEPTHSRTKIVGQFGCFGHTVDVGRMLLAVRVPVGGTARMGHGFFGSGSAHVAGHDGLPPQAKYDAVTVSSQTEGEPLGSLDVESGVTTIQTTWSRKK